MTIVRDGRIPNSEFVDIIWSSHSEADTSFISSATTQWEMVVTRYEGETMLTVRGPETKASIAEFPTDMEFFGIAFKLGTFMPHLPVKALMDRMDLNLPQALSNSFWLDSAAWQFPTYENADIFVEQLVRKGLLMRDPSVEAVLQGETPDLSLRALQYRFSQVTGLTHTMIRQIERAHHAATLLTQGTTVLDTVYAAGYFDQAHLSRSLKRFMGQTPRQLLKIQETP